MWVALVGKRTLDISYTNDTARTIQVYALTGADAVQRARFFVAGLEVSRTSANGFAGVTAVVPPGQGYHHNVFGGANTLTNWIELR